MPEDPKNRKVRIGLLCKINERGNMKEFLIFCGLCALFLLVSCSDSESQKETPAIKTESGPVQIKPRSAQDPARKKLEELVKSFKLQNDLRTITCEEVLRKRGEEDFILTALYGYTRGCSNSAETMKLYEAENFVDNLRESCAKDKKRLILDLAKDTGCRRPERPFQPTFLYFFTCKLWSQIDPELKLLVMNVLYGYAKRLKQDTFVSILSFGDFCVEVNKYCTQRKNKDEKLIEIVENIDIDDNPKTELFSLNCDELLNMDEKYQFYISTIFYIYKLESQGEDTRYVSGLTEIQVAILNKIIVNTCAKNKDVRVLDVVLNIE